MSTPRSYLREIERARARARAIAREKGASQNRRASEVARGGALSVSTRRANALAALEQLGRKVSARAEERARLLRGGVGRRRALGGVVVVEHLREAEVDDLDDRLGAARAARRAPEEAVARRLVLEQQVLGLEVAVDDAARVHEVDRREDLAQHRRGGRLGELALLDDVIEELAALHDLHHEQDALLVDEHVRELDDRRVRAVALEREQHVDLVLELREQAGVPGETGARGDEAGGEGGLEEGRSLS